MDFKILRGTNISHWLSQSARRGAERRAWFTQRDVAMLAQAGVDHLRLPVDEEQMWDASGKREPEAWDLLRAAVDWCLDAGLRAIVDLHILRSHYFNQQGEPALFTDPAKSLLFADLWRDLSSELRGRPVDRVAYELMNEPVASDPEAWNLAWVHPYRVIRKAEPDRWILLGSNRWNSISTLGALKIPADDRRLMLTFHYYSPFLVTHYKAPWARTGLAYSGPIHYPGLPIRPQDMAGLDAEARKILEPANTPFDISNMETDIAAALAVAQRAGLPLHCGEFGVLQTVPDDIRRAWYRDFRLVLERHAIAWSNWDYKGGFGLVDGDGRPTVVMEALLGKK